MKETITIAVIQMQIEADAMNADIAALNEKRALERLEAALALKPDLILFPDEITGGYAYGPFNIPRQFEIPLVEEFKKKSAATGVYIAGSFLGRIETIACSSIGYLITPEQIIFKQQRINIFQEEKEYVLPGDKLEVFATGLGKIGFAVQVDLLIPEVCRILKAKGAELILAPCYYHSSGGSEKPDSYPANFFRTAAAARAFENQVPVVLANGIGIEYVSKSPLCGGSAVFTPSGLNAAASAQEEILISTITPPDKSSQDLASYNLENLRNSSALAVMKDSLR